MKCRFCNNTVEEGRQGLSFTSCLECAMRGRGQQPKYKGTVVYGHKTGGEVQVMSPESFAQYRRYNPYTRYSGRGSGVHAMMKTTASR